MVKSKEKKEKISKVLKEKGEEWVIAALVYGSIGYHTPNHAKELIEKFKRGEEKDYCERCIALFDGDLVEMLFWDVRKFERLEERDPEKVKRLIEFVRKVSKLDEENQLYVSLAYPIMSI